jgi:hypothetical protein
MAAAAAAAAVATAVATVRGVGITKVSSTS